MARITNRQIESHVASMLPFQANSAIGEAFPKWVSMGRLPSEYHASAGDSPVYVVFSYATPIAWVAVDGSVTVPAVKYSVTTSRTQNAVRAAFGMDRDQEHKPAE